MSPSPTPGAPKTLEEVKTLLKDDTKVKVAGVDIDGVLRGKIMSVPKFLSAAKSDFGFCSVIFGWDIHDQTYTRELTISNRANGYRDIAARIDLSTYRRIPWENNIPFFLVSFINPDNGEPLHACPRSMLENMTLQAREMGKDVAGEEWECMAGAEYEYFQFKETAQSVAEKGFHKLQALTPGMHGYSLLRPNLNQEYFHELYDAATVFGIEIEGHHTETGPGVFETALAYTDASRMADNGALFKLMAKSVGMKYGIMPTFMAKPYGNLPGCSGHIHVSLRFAKTGKNIFALTEEEIKAGGRADAAFKDTKHISQIAEWFLAGVMTGLSDVMPMLCPTINSYKRLVGGEGEYKRKRVLCNPDIITDSPDRFFCSLERAAYWAPNLASYGYDSRAASVRIIGPPDVPAYATRFEIRVPGADVHPMLAFAAIFALGLRGIKQKLPLPFGPIGSPGVTKETLPKLATSLEAATERFLAPDSIARELFGDLAVDHIGGTRQHEVQVWKEAVTSWELERYLELA